MIFYILIGIGLLIMSYMDFKKDETDAGMLSHWLSWVDIDRESSPSLYWLFICAQVAAGFFMIYLGLTGHK